MVSGNEVYDFGSASVSYKASADGETVVAKTSAPGPTAIVSYEDFARSTSPHIYEWATFFVLCGVPMGIPYFMYTSSRAKYAVKSE